jgi:predicted ATP-dependent protease
MFFKRNKAKSSQVQDKPAFVPNKDDVRPLSANELRRSVGPKSLGFKSTSDVTPADELCGQERALEAIDFGLGMKALDFNIFVQGPTASGRRTAVKARLVKAAVGARACSDWVYVCNFEDAIRPVAIALPAGGATRLARAMVEVMEDVRASLPAAFVSEDYLARRRSIEEECRARQDGGLEALNQKAGAQNIAILRTPLGFGMAPMHEGKVVKPDVFNQLPESMRKEVEARIGDLQTELETILAAAPKTDKLRRKRLSALNEEVALVAVGAALDDVNEEFADIPDVVAFLSNVRADLVRSAESFLSPLAGEAPPVAAGDVMGDARVRRYLVNVLIANDSDGGSAPIVEEINPTFENLAGRAEFRSQDGLPVADFLSIKPGALHRANGGFLLLDARALLKSPPAWGVLKRSLKSGDIRIERESDLQVSSGVHFLEPAPIPLSVKVILVGDEETYKDLSESDPDFLQLFKVLAEFRETVARSKETDQSFGRLAASIVRTHGLKPFDAGAVARIMEEAARLAEDRDKLSLEIGPIADLMREADYWAGSAGHKIVDAADVARALKENVRRSSRLRELSQGLVEQGVILVDTEGQKVGQVNALSLHQQDPHAFGHPSRITARVHLGPGRVTDIEREANLGGPLHAKGVMILWGFLAGRFAQDVPLALAGSLVFEQTYSPIDGDSAAAAELCALLSALAEAPIRQDLAVTGSINQFGEVQAVGGVNEKIEGFFDICSSRELSGTQGVVIPRANAQHLMLREDVVEAVGNDRFSVYAVETIDECMELLTGLKAGERRGDGSYPAGSVNRLVEDKLKTFAERNRKFFAARGRGLASGEAAQ